MRDIPQLGLGTYKISDTDVTDLVLSALDIGYTHIDTAQRYENESGVGRAMAQSAVPRDEIWLTTKVWLDKFNYQGCYDSILESLRKLQTDYLDLVLLHRPNTRIGHHNALDALLQLKQEKKIRHIGVSNFPIAQVQDALNHCGPGSIYTNQIEMHPLFDPYICRTWCQENNIYVSAYSPFGHGEIFQEPYMQILTQIAQKYGATPGQVALARLAASGADVLLPKTSGISRLEENFGYSNVSLDQEDIKLIDGLPKDIRLGNPVFHPLWDD